MHKYNEQAVAWSADFGTNLQRMLHRKGMTQGTLAKRLGVTEPMVSRYVRGVAMPSIFKVCQMADILDCEVSDLIKTKYDL